MQTSKKERSICRRSESDSLGEPLWMLSFADLLTLLLTFFVMKLSMSTFDGAATGGPAKELTQIQITKETKASYPQEGIALGKGSGTAIQLGESSFLKGSAELSFDGSEKLRAVAMVAAGQDVKVEIVGRAFASESFSKGSWQLAIERSFAAVRQMIDAGVEPHAISAAAYVVNDEVESNADEALTEGKSHLEVIIKLPEPQEAMVQVS